MYRYKIMIMAFKEIAMKMMTINNDDATSLNSNDENWSEEECSGHEEFDRMTQVIIAVQV